MKGLQSFSNEWNRKDTGEEILNITVIDDPENLKAVNHYKEYPFVTDTIPASVFDKDLIYASVRKFFEGSDGDISILILSDDMVDSENVDATALANLVYIQEIISSLSVDDPSFADRIDIVVEIVNPRHHDIVNSYSVRNVVISNRYISKMITQIGEKDSIYDLYNEIFTYDSGSDDCYDSKEIYVKKVSTFFKEIPPKCSERDLIYSVWKASIDGSIPNSKRSPTVPLGYVTREGNVYLFNSDNNDMIQLDSGDKLIVYSNH